MRRGTTGDSEASLLCVLAAVDDPATMGALLKEVLTDAEYRALCRRWTILKRLREGRTQRAVAAEIGTTGMPRASSISFTRMDPPLFRTSSIILSASTIGVSSSMSCMVR